MAKESLTRASELQKENRKKLVDLFVNSPIPSHEQLINLGLYMRSSYLASILFLDEIYKKILPIPGVVMEFGIWWGANLAILQSLRGVYEPYNYTRKVIGFDTFEGYPASMKDQDKNSKYLVPGNYSVTEGYEEYLTKVLQYHEDENVMSHKKKFDLVRGDITQTLPEYLARNPQTIISLAYFDLGLYEPTKKSLEAILPCLTKGSILIFDELNHEDMPGETTALKEVIGLGKHDIVRSTYTPDRCYMVMR